jgi:hypothetical protein
MATWLSGNGVQPEFAPMSQRRMAGSGLFGGADKSENWFHFPMTTPVIIDDKRPKLTKFFVLYRMRFSSVLAVQVWSGAERLLVVNVPQESGLIRDHPDIKRDQFEEGKTMFSLDAANSREPVDVRQGLSISVKVKFDSSVHQQLFGQWIDVPRNIGTIEFYSAGADWDFVAT